MTAFELTLCTSWWQPRAWIGHSQIRNCLRGSWRCAGERIEQKSWDIAGRVWWCKIRLLTIGKYIVELIVNVRKLIEKREVFMDLHDYVVWGLTGFVRANKLWGLCCWFRRGNWILIYAPLVHVVEEKLVLGKYHRDHRVSLDSSSMSINATRQKRWYFGETYCVSMIQIIL